MESDLWSFIRGSVREATAQLVAVPNEGNVSTDSSAGMSSEKDCLCQMSLEKELFAAVRCRSVAESGDLLEKVQNVNAIRENGETPLYLAVLLGKSDWTETLLSMGSDPCVADGAGVTALLVAEEMCKAAPSDSERKFILGLVKLASKLGRKGGGDPDVRCPVSETRLVGDLGGMSSLGADGSVTADGGGTSDVGVSSVGTSGGTSTASRESSSQSKVEERLEKLTSMVAELSRKVDSLGIKASSLKEGVETLVDNASIQGTAVSEMRTEVAGIKSQLSTGLQEIRRQVGMENGASMLQVRGIRESVQKMAVDMRKRDELLRSIESGVTTLVDQRHDEQSSLGSEEGDEEDDNDCSESESDIDQSECHQCSDYLSGIAQYHGDRECLGNLTAYFDNLYSQGKLLSSLLRYMRENKSWELLVDFENSDIGARWPDFKDLEGKCIGDSGPKVRSHASRRFVYISAKLHGVYTEDRLVGWLAIAMARMAMLLAFRNRCKPYAKGDGRSEAKFREVVTDAEQKLSQLGSARLNWYLKNALEWKTPEAKEIALISAVPGIIAHYGRSEGVHILREQLPSLLNYYRDYVITKFERNTRGS
ncbi:uncharacterized protein LOC124172624 isoform X1 [Ischnura elegans]|uniref:uncharacterized protein LOC124172624 isoform X1 n=1 Tax=Ischnura elegans TaxID=197161 RepID=UPI001ED89B50|nr:uncharacterized protein LOC124172624 isoform X1 [Ischnura elegans]